MMDWSALRMVSMPLALRRAVDLKLMMAEKFVCRSTGVGAELSRWR
jgi:hypothetical protein